MLWLPVGVMLPDPIPHYFSPIYSCDSSNPFFSSSFAFPPHVPNCDIPDKVSIQYYTNIHAYTYLYNVSRIDDIALSAVLWNWQETNFWRDNKFITWSRYDSPSYLILEWDNTGRTMIFDITLYTFVVVEERTPTRLIIVL